MKDYLNCCMCLGPLTEAVNLHGCNHKLNFECAKRYFGQMQNGQCTPRPCPLCKSRVTAYSVDHTCRDLVRRVLNSSFSMNSQTSETSVDDVQSNNQTRFEDPFIFSPFPPAPERTIRPRSNIPLHGAITNDQVSIEAIKTLIDDHYSEYLNNYRDGEGRSLVHLAVSIVKIRQFPFKFSPLDIESQKKRSEEILAYLLQNKPNIDIQDNQGKTPLHYAVERGHAQNVINLVEHSASVNITDKNGFPPHSYIQNDLDGIVTYLLNNGANPNRLSYFYLKNALFKKAEFFFYDGLDGRKLSELKFLIEKGFDPNHVDRDTLLHQVDPDTSLEMIRYLLQVGASKKSRNHRKETPAECYRRKNIQRYEYPTAGDKERLSLLTVEGECFEYRTYCKSQYPGMPHS